MVIFPAPRWAACSTRRRSNNACQAAQTVLALQNPNDLRERVSMCKLDIPAEIGEESILQVVAVALFQH
jgi:hypothetical protein